MLANGVTRTNQWHGKTRLCVLTDDKWLDLREQNQKRKIAEGRNWKKCKYQILKFKTFFFFIPNSNFFISNNNPICVILKNEQLWHFYIISYIFSLCCLLKLSNQIEWTIHIRYISTNQSGLRTLNKRTTRSSLRKTKIQQENP